MQCMLPIKVVLQEKHGICLCNVGVVRGAVQSAMGGGTGFSTECDVGVVRGAVQSAMGGWYGVQYGVRWGCGTGVRSAMYKVQSVMG